jgi:FkbM family methyltransferase
MQKLKFFLFLLHFWRHHPLTALDYSGTIVRFLRWQLGSRIIDAPILFSWIGGTRLLLERGMTGATPNVYAGLHEFADMGFLLHFLRPGDLFADIGANVGTYTILASGVVGASSLAVEPIPETFERLSMNIKLNRIEDRVHLLQCGVGSSAHQTMAFVADHDTMNRVAPPEYLGKKLDVSVVSMDSVCKNFKAALWKVDVEGFEEQVLEGAGRALKSEALVAVQLEGDGSTIRQIMRFHGFSLYNYDPFNRVLTAGDDQRKGANALWIRNLAFVADRCVLGPKFRIGKLEI